MLSDAIKLTRTQLLADYSDVTWLLLSLEVFELEARNMEARLFILTGRPHVALDGRLITAPAYETRKGELRHA